MSGIITEKGITVRQGDSFPILLHFRDERGDKNLNGITITMQVRDTENNLKFSKIAEIKDELKGAAVICLTPNDTNIAVGTYKTDIQLSDDGGNVHTVYPSNINSVAFFKITEQITE